MKSKAIIKSFIIGGVSGLVCGTVMGYLGGYMSPSYKWDLPEVIVEYLIFLVPGIFLGISVGIARRSLKCTFYGIISGIFAGLICYFLYQYRIAFPKTALTVKSVFHLPITDIIFMYLLFSIIYLAFACISLSIINKSLAIFFRSLIGGIVALFISIPFVVVLMAIYALAHDWARGGGAVESVVIGLTGTFIVLGSLLTAGIMVGSDQKIK